MAETSTALKQTDAFIEVDTLNALPLAHVFKATAPARIVAENVSVGPVEVFDKPGEEWWLVRIEGRVDVLKATEVEALEASTPQVLRYLARLADRRARAEAEAKRQAKVAASIAKCPQHRLREIQIGRCLYRIVCDCGYVETVSSDG